MKHFIQARQDALDALSNAEITALSEKVCLIVDLQGRTWVLAKPTPEADINVLRDKVTNIVSKAADIFWGNKVWIEERNMTPANKTLYKTAWDEARREPAGQDRKWVLDRHLSKDAWLGTPVESPWPLKDQTPPIISFYSFKGGVGRTTALLAVAISLARAGKSAVVIDFDLEAPGAGSSLPPAEGISPGLGVLEFLIDFAVAPKDSLDIGEYYHQCDDRKIIMDGEPIYVMPSGTLDQSYLEKLARVNYEYLYQTAGTNNASSPLLGLFRRLRAKLNADVFLIDSRAGFHDLGGLSLSGIAHFQVLFGLDSGQSWEGMRLAITHLGKDMIQSGRVQRDCAIVHSMVSPSVPVKEKQLQRFREKAFQVFCDNYYDSADSTAGEWPVPDPESTESPHFPCFLTWDEKVRSYQYLGEIADVLCTGEYRALSEFILEKVGKSL